MGSGHRPYRPPPPPGGGREDCWSEGETGTLIDAWGDRYLELNRGNLRQKDWSEVAAAVNARLEALGRPRKTDIQCKNRVDTIKKKYKIEKARPRPSQWPFFGQLDHLILPSPAPPAPKKPPSRHRPSLDPKPSLSFTVKNRSPNPLQLQTPVVYSGGSSSRSRMNSPLPTESSHEDSGDEDDYDGLDEDEKDERRNGKYDSVSAGKRPWGFGGGAEGAFGELAKAVLNFADIYERVESSKQQQMMELERQRMEFAKDLEFQRMQTFMETQLELEKMKRPKYASGSGLMGYLYNKERYSGPATGLEDKSDCPRHHLL